MRNPALTYLSLCLALSLAACSRTGVPETQPTIIRFSGQFPGEHKIIPEDDQHEIECRATGKHEYTRHGLLINAYHSIWDSKRAFLGKQSTLTISFKPTVIDTIVITGYDHTLYLSQIIDGGSILVDFLDEPLPLNPKRKNGEIRRVVDLKKFYPGWLEKQWREATSITLVARGYDEYRVNTVEIFWMEKHPY